MLRFVGELDFAVGGCALIVAVVDDAFDHAAGAEVGGLADAVADTVLV